MEINKMLEASGFAAVIAAITFGWSYVKGFSRYILGAILLQKTLDEALSYQLHVHLRERYRKLPSGVSEFKSLREYVGGSQNMTYIPIDMPNSTSVWHTKHGIFVVNYSGAKLSLISLRFLSNPHSLVNDSLDDYDSRVADFDKSNGGNFYVKQCMGNVGSFEVHAQKRSAISSVSTSAEPSQQLSGYDILPHRQVDASFRYARDMYIKNVSNRNPLRGLFYPEDVIQLLADLQRWYDRRSWYQERGIPWRTGVLLHGPGGTGKSSLSKAVAQMLGVPLYQYSLNTFSDAEFVSEWSEMTVPCVVALEDFDTVFHGRESTTVHKSLSFECVLNQISGISAVNGVLLIVTTNNLHHIDAALGQMDESGRPTRPGRIDRILHMGNTTEEQRRQIAKYTLDFADANIVDMLVQEYENTTAAQFQSACIEYALTHLAEKEKNSFS